MSPTKWFILKIYVPILLNRDILREFFDYRLYSHYTLQWCISTAIKILYFENLGKLEIKFPSAGVFHSELIGGGDGEKALSRAPPELADVFPEIY